jgi:hypothetical protein
MSYLDQFLALHKKEIVDSVEQKTAEQKIIFDKLVNELAVKMPLAKDGTTGIDKAHIELAITLVHSMWCGWLSEAKKNRGVFTQEYVNGFKQAIIRAFEIGQNYAPERP